MKPLVPFTPGPPSWQPTTGHKGGGADNRSPPCSMNLPNVIPSARL